MNRILFFIHYNKYNCLANYVLYLLEHIKHIYSRMVFISNSPISDENKTKIEGLCSEIILRENKGFDFGAWKDALLKESWDKLSQYDSVTLMNDTCFGPIFDLEPVYIKMEQQNIDFWGMTNNGKPNKALLEKNLPEHIQSYFLCFNSKVVLSKTFQLFWNNIKYFMDVGKVIHKYEIQFTGLLSKAGFRYSVLFNTINFIRGNDIVAFSNPDLIIQNMIPLVKIKSFIYFPYQKVIIDMLNNRTGYPVKFISDYATTMFEPNISLKICNKLKPIDNVSIESNNTTIAIHIHVFYLDVFEKYIYYLSNILINFDLFITTDSTDKEKKIKTALKETSIEKKLKNIFITENRGQDIFPWLSITHVLDKYDIVGHFHTKKSPETSAWVVESWLQDILELLLVPINSIIEEFRHNQNFGIIIPEIPYYRRINPYILDDKNISSELQNLWNKMNCKKNMDFYALKTLIMPYGTMLWYRPAALSSLFKLKLSSTDFPSEPISCFRIAHCIEHLLVYIAWNDGFDYRIMVFNPPITSSFIDNMVVSDLIWRIDHSKAYRIGQIILAIPKLFKKLLLKK